MSAAREVGLILGGWTAIIVIALICHWLSLLQSRWEYRQHQRNLGRIPPRRPL
jgi:hypothetical protein